MMNKAIFKFLSATQFLPAFCGIEVTPMIRHKIRGADGNGKPIDFSPEEKEKIQKGIQKFYKQFGTGELTLADLLERTGGTAFVEPFKLKGGKATYEWVVNSTGELVSVGTGSTTKRWLPRNTPIELINPKN